MGTPASRFQAPTLPPARRHPRHEHIKSPSSYNRWKRLSETRVDTDEAVRLRHAIKRHPRHAVLLESSQEYWAAWVEVETSVLQEEAVTREMQLAQYRCMWEMLEAQVSELNATTTAQMDTQTQDILRLYK